MRYWLFYVTFNKSCTCPKPIMCHLGIIAHYLPDAQWQKVPGNSLEMKKYCPTIGMISSLDTKDEGEMKLTFEDCGNNTCFPCSLSWYVILGRGNFNEIRPTESLRELNKLSSYWNKFLILENSFIIKLRYWNMCKVPMTSKETSRSTLNYTVEWVTACQWDSAYQKKVVLGTVVDRCAVLWSGK